MRYITLFCICLVISSCSVLRKRDNKKIVKAINKHIESVYATADTMLTLANHEELYIVADTLTNPVLKNKLLMLGNKAYVYFKRSGGSVDTEPYDSVVVFSSITPLGKVEIFYEFAETKREYQVYESYKWYDNHSFIKIAPGIYLKRSEIPFM